jgi:uncharacterized PurR-regulated membrane protein YhhQ (DUF165 family)
MSTMTAPAPTRRRTGVAIAAGLGLLASIIAANYLTTRFGFVPVGFGLTATAGTLAAGFALALRDAVQDAHGRRAVAIVIILGAGLSLAVAPPDLALASAVAFLVAELVDFGVYTPIRRRAQLGDRRWAAAVVASNTLGAVVDTAVFIGIAFGAAAIAPAMLGQLVGKAWATLSYLVVGATLARRRRSA